jgi:hypothetical protein
VFNNDPLADILSADVSVPLTPLPATTVEKVTGLAPPAPPPPIKQHQAICTDLDQLGIAKKFSTLFQVNLH